MKTFISLMLHMGVINLTNLQDYWSTDPFLQTNNIWKSVMSRDRFLLLLRFWHFEEPDATESPLQKISLLMDHLNNTMAAIYCPDQDLSLDESMVLWRGRLIFRQYIKNERHKYGVKMYELCESSGIILRSSIFSGIAYPDRRNLGQTGAIVMKLLDHSRQRVYCIC